MAQRNREDLGRKFKRGDTPSERDFRDFIESTLNIVDDGVDKSREGYLNVKSPLRVTIDSGSSQNSKETLLEFYTKTNNIWTINQKPEPDVDGFNLTSPSGSSRFFVKSDDGNIGINNFRPRARLHIRQTANYEALRIDNEENDTSPSLLVKNGNVGIGINNLRPQSKLHIQQTANQEALRIDDGENNTPPSLLVKNGNVGIGTENAHAKLHIHEGDLAISYSKHILVSPEQTRWPNNKLIGTGWDAPNKKDFVQIFVPGSQSTANPVMTLRSDGNVGIGITTPSRGKLEISGSSNFRTGVKDWGFLRNNRDHVGRFSNDHNGTRQISLYADNTVAASEFLAHSDIRLKQIECCSNGQTDLATLRQIQITDYILKDSFFHDNRPHKKVLGQQVAQVFPQAVSTHVDVVPDIFQPASVDQGWVSLPGHGLQVGERVKLLSEESQVKIYTVEAATEDGFQVDLDYTGQIFVYGREVDDFHVVDYDALSMLNISATQELCTIIDRLQTEVQHLKDQLTALHHSPVACP